MPIEPAEDGFSKRNLPSNVEQTSAESDGQNNHCYRCQRGIGKITALN